MFKRNIISLLIFLFTAYIGQAFAEYRVYQYYVSSTISKKIDPSSYLVTSTLDPVSYKAYNGGPSSIKVDLLRTWICKGSTAKRPPCPPPLSVLQLKAEQNIKRSY